MTLGPFVDDLFSRPPEEGLTLALVVEHQGAVVAERYGRHPANDFQPARQIAADSTLVSWSTAKSITHAAVGILVRDGLLDLDAPAPVPEWTDTEKAPITLLQLLEMRSGLHFVEDYVDGDVSNYIEMLFGESGPSHAAYAAHQPLEHPPGTFWNYSSGTTNIVTRIIADALGARRDAPDRREAVMTGVPPPSPVRTLRDGFGDPEVRRGRRFRRLVVRVRHGGRLRPLRGAVLVRRGHRDAAVASGSFPEGWLDHARTQVATDPDDGRGYGRHWWLWPELPGGVVANGYEGQRIIVLPDDDLVLVHLGKTDISAAPQLNDRLLSLIRAVLG